MKVLRVSVVHALPETASEVSLQLPEGATVADAIEAATRLGIECDETVRAVGIFGRRVRRDALLRDGDRVEFYRALKVDPKQRRRRRATEKRR